MVVRIDIEQIILLAILLFLIIYFAIRFAINPLLKKSQEVIEEEKSEFGLDAMNYIGVLSDEELFQVKAIYQNKGLKKKNHEHYLKHAKVIEELKELDYLSEEAFNNKMAKLKNHYNEN